MPPRTVIWKGLVARTSTRTGNDIFFVDVSHLLKINVQENYEKLTLA